MPRKKKTKVTEPTTETTQEPVVEEAVQPKPSPFKEIALKLIEELKDSGLKVEFVEKPSEMIKIYSSTGIHCYSRVLNKDTYFLGQYLSALPSGVLNLVQDVYKKLGIIDRKEVYLSPSGFP
jgi:hypothetical protein